MPQKGFHGLVGQRSDLDVGKLRQNRFFRIGDRVAGDHKPISAKRTGRVFGELRQSIALRPIRGFIQTVQQNGATPRFKLSLEKGLVEARQFLLTFRGQAMR